MNNLTIHDKDGLRVTLVDGEAVIFLCENVVTLEMTLQEFKEIAKSMGEFNNEV